MSRHALHLDTTVVFTRVELLCALRHLRIRKDHVALDLARLEERRETLGAQLDPVAVSAILAVATELALLDAITQRLWLPIAEATLNETPGEKTP